MTYIPDPTIDMQPTHWTDTKKNAMHDTQATQGGVGSPLWAIPPQPQPKRHRALWDPNQWEIPPTLTVYPLGVPWGASLELHTVGGGGFVGGLFCVGKFVFQIDREIYHTDSGGLREISYACCRYHKIFFGAFGTSVLFVRPQWQR